MKKIKLIQYLTLLCSIVILLFSCEKDDDNNKPSADVDMTFPVGWEVTWNYSDIIVLLGISPVEGVNDDFLENVNVAKERAEGLTLESYYGGNLNALKVLDNYVFISSADTIIGGLNSKKLIFTATINDIDLEFMDFIFYVGSYGYIITCTAKESTFNDYKSIFEQIAGTFKII